MRHVLARMAAPFLDRLLGRAEPTPPAPEPAAPPSAPERDGDALHAALATKVLHAWAQNRQQVRVPLTLRLGWLEPEQRALVVQAMAAALGACGFLREPAEQRLAAALARAGGDAAVTEGAPPDLIPLLAAIEAARLGAHAYAAAALVLDRRVAAERAFLDFLGARFGLPPSLTADLARRYRR